MPVHPPRFLASAPQVNTETFEELRLPAEQVSKVQACGLLSSKKTIARPETVMK